jgi:hypothetical protein
LKSSTTILVVFSLFLTVFSGMFITFLSFFIFSPIEIQENISYWHYWIFHIKLRIIKNHNNWWKKKRNETKFTYFGFSLSQVHSLCLLLEREWSNCDLIHFLCFFLLPSSIVPHVAYLSLLN